eukprot:CAMPEP_0170070764 /NCGR_PEP_ID=MMETSP0019_2-20121128/8932_1 /TAXON_ID=98059 /ORGANISM="Dinobryon sp., Strain UTEXLB2267" /LENGTH=949 /DNA_ID=CAMNT_0010279121 /DNA_START=35 /DNA_END=2881 /DNA_ORIENTATION=-
MTYTSRDRSEIRMNLQRTNRTLQNSFLENVLLPDIDYKLWKISNPSSSKLNRQPVLFVPGHRANADLVRSLSSSMHDPHNEFQFFTVDFDEERTLLHGSFILNQAVFVNLAIRKIHQMYRKVDNEQRLIVIGYSAGGIVARTAMLLSNHPKRCVVSDLILLSSPVSRPPFSAEPSLELLYKEVNKAWLLSFYNTSRDCLHHHISSSSQSTLPLAANFVCPTCVPKLRVVSISGGELDILVFPELSTLHDITPRPRNVTSHKLAPSSHSPILTFFSFINKYTTSIVYLPFKAILTVFSRFDNSNSSSNSSALNSTSIDQLELGEESNSSAELSSNVCSNLTSTEENCVNEKDINREPVMIENLNGTSDVGPFSYVNKESWNIDMVPYIEPQFLSLRSMQLQGVELPIDHFAIVWCYQLLHVVLKGMRTITNNVNAEDGYELLTTAFPVSQRYDIDYNQTVKSNGQNIKQLERFLARNESIHMLHRAHRDELFYIKQQLGGSTLQSFAFTFVMRKAPTIYFWYLVLSLLIITVPLVRSLAKHSSFGKSQQMAFSNYNALLPGIHFNLDIKVGPLMNFLHTFFPAYVCKLLLWSLFSVPVVIWTVVVYFTDWSEWTAFGPRLMNLYVAYWMAIVLRGLLIGIVYILQYLASNVICIMNTIWRYTFYNKWVRRAVRTTVKWLKKRLGIKDHAVTWFLTVFLISVVLSILCYYGNDRINGPHYYMGYTVFIISTISIVSYLAACLGILLALLYPPYKASKVDASAALNYFNFVDLFLLYFPTIVMALPSVNFSLHLVLGNPGYMGLTHHSVTELNSLFGPERIHCCIFMTAIAYHIWSARNARNLAVCAVLPLSWLTELVGPSQFVSMTDLWAFATSGVTNLEKLKIGYENIDIKATGACIHEDGGKNAIFEALPTELGLERVAISPEITLGSSYRVIWCNCAKNPRFKDSSEW